VILFGIQLMPRQASSIALQVDLVYGYLTAISVFFTVLIAVAAIYLSVRHRRRSEQEVPPEVHGNIFLEIIWIAVPTVIALSIFVTGAVLFFHMSTPPPGTIEIYGVGKQWMWKFQHPEGQREINDLHVPVGQPVRVTLTSEDVLHSFYVPDFRVKMDVVPGRYTSTWFEATKAGVYNLFCAEYCGTSHSGMIGKVYAMLPQDYEKWLQKTSGDGVSMASRGQKLFEEKRCNSCHGQVSSALGPPLKGIYGSDVALVDGRTIKVDDKYLRESILFPRKKVVAGYEPVMPTYHGQISEEDLLQIISYVKSLTKESNNESDTTTKAADETSIL